MKKKLLIGMNKYKVFDLAFGFMGACLLAVGIICVAEFIYYYPLINEVSFYSIGGMAVCGLIFIFMYCDLDILYKKYREGDDKKK